MAKNITVEFEDGTAHVYKNVPDSVSIEDANARAAKEFGKAVVSSPSLLHTGEVGLNALYKGVASGIDALLNTPANLVNLGIVGYGTAKGLMGGKDLPEPIQTPDFARRGLESVGLIRKDVAPQSTAERIVEATGQGLGGAALSPASSGAGVARNLALGGVSGLAGQSAKEATGSDLAAALASVATPAAIGGLASAGRNQIARLQEQKSANAASDSITKQGMSKGYVLPPSKVNPNAVTKTLESIGGKAATRQEAEIRNQEVTNRLVKEQIGIPNNQPITEDSLEKLRTKYSQPYREVAAIPPITTQQQVVSGASPLKMVSNTVNPAQLLKDLKTARADANGWYKAYNVDKRPDTLATAKQYQQTANDLEDQLEQVAISVGKPELVNELRNARKQIAQTYTVEQALNVGSTNVDARAIGRMRDRGVPLTGNLKLIGEFAEQNPLYTSESSAVSTPGVSALDAIAAGMAVAGGKPQAGGVILARGPARAIALSKWFQGMAAQPNYDPSVVAKMLKSFKASEIKAAMARAGMMAPEMYQQ